MSIAHIMLGGSASGRELPRKRLEFFKLDTSVDCKRGFEGIRGKAAKPRVTVCLL